MAAKKNSIRNENASTNSSQSGKNENQENRSEKTSENNEKTATGRQRIGGDGPRAKPIRRSARAGLVFPVHRVHAVLKEQNSAFTIRHETPVYLAGVLEYLTAEMVELSGNAARDHKRKRIIPRDIFLAIHHDEELSQVCQKTTIAAGGVLPHIHQVLMPPKSLSQSLKGDASVPRKKSKKSSS